MAVVERAPDTGQFVRGHRDGAEHHHGGEESQEAAERSLGEEELDQLPTCSVSAGDDHRLEEEAGEEVSAEEGGWRHGAENRQAAKPRQTPPSR